MTGEITRQTLLEFLYTHLPQSDLDCYPAALWEEFADHALFLRQVVPWCRELEEELFCHYVLFPRVNDEDLSPHRRLFFEALWPRVRDLESPEERILEVNRWCHELASYQAQDARTASPLTVYRCGSGRCGEESAFLVAALRSVGIPARQVYAPRWAHCDDNHAWVEALCDGRWRFLGACEPEPVLDKGWFNTAASRALLVHSRLFGAGVSPLHGAPLGTRGGVTWYDQTARYAVTRRRIFRALHNGAPAPGAVFRVQVLNEGAFHTIATLPAGEDGEASLELGLGDVHVLVTWRGLRAEADCAGDGTFHLETPEQADTDWTFFDVHAPQATDRTAVALTPTQRARREGVLEQGNALRQARLAGFCRTGKPQFQDLLDRARGNADTIAAFLDRDGDPLRLALVESLSEKDLRDVSARVLEDHFQNAPPQGDLPWAVYVPWVLCPRVELEPLTPWRGFLRRELAGVPDPRTFWKMLEGRVDTAVERTYADLVWTPEGCWRARRGDGRSRRLLFVAGLRALGIPARLRELDDAPEYWHGGGFRTLNPEPTGTLVFTGPKLVYGQDWSLARWTEGGWQRLSLPQGAMEQTLPAGDYRLITTLRLPNGNQFAARREMALRAGERRTVELLRRSFALGDLLGRQTLPPMTGRTLSGRERPLCPPGQARLLLWLSPGEEPTEHLLNELLAQGTALAEGAAELVVLLKDPALLGQRTMAQALDRLALTVLLDDWAYDAEQTARCLACDPSSLPLAVVCDRAGRAVYATAGYRVGSVALLAQIVDYLNQGGE